MLPVISRNNWMPEVFNDFFDTDFMTRTKATAPAINVKETEKDYTVEVAAPGMTKDDFNVNIDKDGNLHIHMEAHTEKKEEDKKSHYLRRELPTASLNRRCCCPTTLRRRLSQPE